MSRSALRDGESTTRPFCSCWSKCSSGTQLYPVERNTDAEKLPQRQDKDAPVGGFLQAIDKRRGVGTACLLSVVAGARVAAGALTSHATASTRRCLTTSFVSGSFPLRLVSVGVFLASRHERCGCVTVGTWLLFRGWRQRRSRFTWRATCVIALARAVAIAGLGFLATLSCRVGCLDGLAPCYDVSRELGLTSN
ncbi:hypothetical protein SPRG_16925 [Saprolegnia parasitica CBS 223.65]|uniref:Uncharacterized protein n=1 Tax=Saprolegnia parasitica (strain CBS 223.65) TaxID=695850 RepID=A0A067BLU1_SAPPC|nr:hypothetical protein SPRG_16925 [Saprolegnia parasitica CBS 223.65]KDO17670.1 hypothetical protein SPRG_16925 [Saprolegnia parasitica CBS 223.65]|eukprot:XP_012211623.1 hypothetical protein SPRG_16925 [Saprolegnia parasitica CBS 223.65]